MSFLSGRLWILKTTTKIKKYLKWIFLSSLCGLLSGTATFVFLQSLSFITDLREKTPLLIFGLPFAGLLIGYLYFLSGNSTTKGTNLILEEIHDPKNVVPFRMAPLILFSTLLTHLFGGSAGREGTAVQIGSSLSDQLFHFFRISQEERKILLVAGASAGFSAAIGAPIAGMIFGMEVIHIGRLRFFAWIECAVASYIAFYTALLLGAPHSHFPRLDLIEFNLKTLFFILFAGMIFGIAANFFSKMTHFVESIFNRWVKYPPLKPFYAGILLSLLFYYEGSYRYSGLGLSVIQESFTKLLTIQDPLFKSFFTSLTVGSGFKGGEFIPLVYIGSTLGNVLSNLLPVSFKLLASLGFVSVFAGAANTPLTCTLLAIEIFGYQITPYAFVACMMSYYFSGNRGIYKSQKFLNKKFPLFNKNE